MKACNHLLAALMLAGCMTVGCNKTDLSTPKDAARTFSLALERGDAQAAEKASTGADPKVIEAMTKASSAIKKMKDAAIAKFGQEGQQMGGPGPGNWDIAENVDNAEVKESGDTATLTAKGGTQIRLKKIDGQWKVDMSRATGREGEFGASALDQFANAASKTTDEINSGKYKTVLEAKQAFATNMRDAIRGLKIPARD